MILFVCDRCDYATKVAVFRQDYACPECGSRVKLGADSNIVRDMSEAQKTILKGQAQAWEAVFALCQKLGCFDHVDKEPPCTGQERVLSFIEELSAQAQTRKTDYQHWRDLHAFCTTLGMKRNPNQSGQAAMLDFIAGLVAFKQQAQEHVARCASAIGVTPPKKP